MVSDLWKSIKIKVYEQRGSLCLVCKEPATALHHRNYNKSTLLGISLTPIIPLCDTCHKSIEFNENGNKTLQPSIVDKRLLELL